MKKENITRYSLKELREKLASGELKGKTDWEFVDKLTDEEIQADIDSDPDAAPHITDFSGFEWFPHPPKQPVSIRLSQDILAFFRNGGKGWQTRIDQVLRHYMESCQKGRAK